MFDCCFCTAFESIITFVVFSVEAKRIAININYNNVQFKWSV